MFPVAFLALLAAGCSPDVADLPTSSGSDDVPTGIATTVSLTEPRDDCVPTDVGGMQAPGNPDRRIEDIVELLTGERQVGDQEITFQDPNFGGVWGDRQGGIVVAVLDCSQVDANELARIAGGPSRLRLIEVPHTFQEVNEFRDALVAELEFLGVAGDVYIQSTLSGRLIEVHVLDPDQLPESFGDAIPAAAFSIVEAEGLIGEQ